MNKKGFTLIELVTTFALATVIITILINIVVIIKDMYTTYEAKSKLIIEQSTLSSLINRKFYEKSLSTYEPCFDTSFCYKFKFSDESTSTLVVGEDFIKFDSYIYKLTKGSKIEEPTMEIIDIDVTDITSNNAFYVIKIPIKNKLFGNEDFGINIVYQYNSNEKEL